VLNNIEIVDYQTKYRDAFSSLNKEWIDAYFTMEEEDEKALYNPEEYIIDKGGYILVVLLDDRPIAVCALIKLYQSKHDYELAKMAVSPQYHGRGIGYLLGKAVVNKAKSLNAKSLFLESNTILEPAINLYRKLGFVEVPIKDSPYKRSNIQMVLFLPY